MSQQLSPAFQRLCHSVVSLSVMSLAIAAPLSTSLSVQAQDAPPPTPASESPSPSSTPEPTPSLEATPTPQPTNTAQPTPTSPGSYVVPAIEEPVSTPAEATPPSEPLTSPQAPYNFKSDPIKSDPTEENATPTDMPTSTPEVEPTQPTQGSGNTPTPITDPNPAALW